MNNTKIIDFAQNFNALGSPKGLKDFVSLNIDSLFHYPQPQSEGVGTSIAKFIGVKSGSVKYSNGSTELFFSLPRFLKKRKALIVKPTFWEYEQANKKNNIIIEGFILEESKRFNLDIKDLEKELERDVVVYLCNPNNPTSTLANKEQLLETIYKYQRTYFVIDETYLLFRHDYSELTLTKEAQSLPNLYVVASLSKIFSLPGIRSGFLVSTCENISRFSKWQTPYASSSFSEEVTKWLVRQDDFITKTRKYYLEARKVFSDLLNENLKGRILPFKPEANFVLVKILNERTSGQIVNSLRNNGILVRDGVELSGLGNKWLRFSIKKPAQNKRLIGCLDKIL